MCVCVCTVLTRAGHGRRVRLGAEVALVADTGGGALPHRVAVERTLGAGHVCGQGAVVANLTCWETRKTNKHTKLACVPSSHGA